MDSHDDGVGGYCSVKDGGREGKEGKGGKGKVGEGGELQKGGGTDLLYSTTYR